MLALVLSFVATNSLAAPAPLVTDRPDVAESSETVGAGRVQVETSADVETHAAGGQRTTIISTPTKLRVGLIDPLELHLETGGVARVLRDGESRDVGFSDLDFGGKVHLWDEAGLRPSTALLLALTLPIGSDGYSDERWLLSPTLAADWGLGHFGVGLNLGYTAVLERRDEMEDHFRFAFAFGRDLAPLSEALRFYVEIFGEVGLRGEATVIAADGGAAWLITPSLQLDLSFRMGLTDDAPDFGSALGLSFRI